MRRTSERYHHQKRGEQGRGDGYDEDWDDDVYYAAASRPDSAGGSSSGRTTDREKEQGGDDSAPRRGRSGRERERSTSKRHYMKVPNMRQLRAMRPTQTPATDGSHPSSAGGGTSHDPHGRGRLASSSRPGVGTDPGETPPSTTTSLGDGSDSLPLLGQLTPPSLPPPQEDCDSGQASAAAAAAAAGAASSGGDGGIGGAHDAAAAAASPPSKKRGRDAPASGEREAARSEGSLVLLRGSPRRGRDGGAGGRARDDGSSLGDASSSPPPPPLSPASPTAVTAGFAAGVAAGVAAGAAAAAAAADGVGVGRVLAGGKRKRPSLGASQRLGSPSVAWPKLRRAGSPEGQRATANTPTPRRIPVGCAAPERDGQAGGGGRGGKRPDGGGTADGGVSSASRQGQGGSGRGRGGGGNGGKGSPHRGGGGGGGGGAGAGTGGGARPAANGGPALTDRPARWASKDGRSSAWSPLRSPGARSSSRGGDGGSSSSANSGSRSNKARSSLGGVSARKAQSSRSTSSSSSVGPGGFPSLVRGRGGSRSGAGGGEDEEAPTFKLTSVFQAAAANSSLKSRPPRGAWGADKHSRARWRGGASQQNSHARGGRSSSSNSRKHTRSPSAGEASTPSFDPTRMGARPVASAMAEAGEEEEDEVEDVVSDESDDENHDDDRHGSRRPDVDFIHDDSGGGGGGRSFIGDWDDTRGVGRRGGGWDEASGGVADYDDQLLGEEGCGDAASRRADSEANQRRSGEGGEGNASAETTGAATTNSAADGGPARPQPEDARRNDGPGTRLDGTAGSSAAEGDVAVSPAAAHLRQALSDDPAAPTATAAGETPRGSREHQTHGRRRQQQQQQQQQQQPRQRQQQYPPQNEPSKERSPPPRTPVRPPRASFSASSLGRGGGGASSSTAAAASATAGGKWRPSFGSSGGGGRSSPAGAMHAPRTAFSTPSRDQDGAVMPLSGSMGAGTMGSASSRRRRGSGAGNGPLGRLLQQVRARCDGDEARLLSGEFPFRQASTPRAGNTGGRDPDGSDNPAGGGGGSGGKSRRDHGDPRTRCGVALDVTVLRPAPSQGAASVDPGAGLAGGGGGGGGERNNGCGQGGGLVWFSCLVHRVLDVASGPGGSNVGRSNPGDGRSEGAAAARFGRLRPLEGVRVDALFKQDTRRAVDVCPGSQLRIYDPCCAWHDGLGETVVGEDIGGGGGGGGGGRRRALLMCTQLCEPYPSSLPPLPALQEVEDGGPSRRGNDRRAEATGYPM
eukprot:g4969.t1